MKNTLLMVTDASYSLNFMIYLQNIFFNQRQSSDDLKFPYLTTNCEFHSEFEMRFRELWGEVVKRIAEDPINDTRIFSEEKKMFYQGLFANNTDAVNEFNEIYQSFNVWWISTAGRFAVGRSIDIPREKMYQDLTNVLIEKGIKPLQRLNVSLIYDECVLGDVEPSSYFAVLSLDECIKNNEELILKLRLSID